MNFARYQEVFAAYVAKSTEKMRTQEAIAQLGLGLAVGPCAHILSVGSGPGDVDFAMCEALVGEEKTCAVTCIEPNTHFARLLTHVAAARGQRRVTDVRVIASTFANAVLARDGYDAIVASHSLYFMRPLQTFARRVCEALRTNGHFLGVINHRQGMSELHRYFHQELCEPATVEDPGADDIERSFAAHGLHLVVHGIDCEIEVTDAIDGRDPRHNVVSLCLNLDARCLTAEVHAALRQWLLPRVVHRDGAYYLQHRVALMVGTKAASRAQRSTCMGR